MIMQEIFERVKGENARSLAKHGKWIDLPKEEQIAAVYGEVEEWLSAVGRHDIHGEHGEIVELVQVMNVCARRIMYLTGEDQ